jgi:peptidoglycan/LPS O-acetylase OafA/YrhL
MSDTLPLINPTPLSLNLDAQDGLRGICSLFIVVGHMITFWLPQTDPPLFGLEYLSSVTLFFVISGFGLVHVYDQQPASNSSLHHDVIATTTTTATTVNIATPLTTTPGPLETWPQRKQFFLKRVARLAPIYYVSLLIALYPFLVQSNTAGLVSGFIVTPLFLQSLTLIGVGWNGPLWTVSAFVGCYLFFPSILRRLRNKNTKELVRWGLWMQLLSLATVAILLTGLPGILIHMLFPARVSHFVMGVVAGLWAKRQNFTAPTRVAEVCSAILFLILVACALVNAAWGSMGYSNFMYVCEFSVPFLHAIWLSALAHPLCGGLTRRILTSKPASALGQISYSLYCNHFNTIIWFSWALNGEIPTVTLEGMDMVKFPAVWAMVPALAICLGVATILYYLVEKPARIAITAKVTK